MCMWLAILIEAWIMNRWLLSKTLWTSTVFKFSFHLLILQRCTNCFLPSVLAFHPPPHNDNYLNPLTVYQDVPRHWNVLHRPRSRLLLYSVFTPEVPGLRGTLRETNKGAEIGRDVPIHWRNQTWVRVSRGWALREYFYEFPMTTQRFCGEGNPWHGWGWSHLFCVSEAGVCMCC